MLNFCEIVKVFKLQSVPTARYTLLRVEPKIISCFKLGTSTYLQTLYVSANLLEIDFFFFFLMYLVLSQAPGDHCGIFKSKDLTIFIEMAGILKLIT